jgi:hypothetical protein
LSPIQLTGVSKALPRNEVTQPATLTLEPTAGMKGGPPAALVGTVGATLDACAASSATSMPENGETPAWSAKALSKELEYKGICVAVTTPVIQTYS